MQGADLRERNLRWWIKSMCPEALPLKLGRWLTLSKLTEKAVKAARAQVASSPTLSIRKPVVRATFIAYLQEQNQKRTGIKQASYEKEPAAKPTFFV